MKLSVVIITKNASEKLLECIESVKQLADEVLVLDGGSTDETVAIAQGAGARVVKQKGTHFSQWRTQAIKEAKGEWILYIDYDERVAPELRAEIKSIIEIGTFSAYAIPRKNIILGREMRHGGWWPDYVERLFKKENLKEWQGVLHERPLFTGELGYLKHPLVHLKHEALSEMVVKTNEWSEVEARLLFDARHPKISWWRFLHIMVLEAWNRLVVHQAFRDGVEGVIYAFYQVWSRFVTYAKLWEMQREVKR